MPVSGVDVILKLADGKTYTAVTDSSGAYTLQLPPPPPCTSTSNSVNRATSR